MNDRYTEYEFTDKEGDVFHAVVDHDYPIVAQIEYLKGVYEAILAKPLGPLHTPTQEQSQ